MNTMFTNRNSNQNELKSNFFKFAEEIRKSGKNPKQMLDDAINSGKFTPEQINQARTMANLFSGILKNK